MSGCWQGLKISGGRKVPIASKPAPTFERVYPLEARSNVGAGLLAIGLNDLQTQRPVRSLDEFVLQRFKRMHRRELRELADHIFRRMEQNPTVSLAQHGGVVVRIAGSDHAVVQALERQHRLALGVFLAQLVAD